MTEMENVRRLKNGGKIDDGSAPCIETPVPYTLSHADCPICGGADLGCTWGLSPEEVRADRASWK